MEKEIKILESKKEAAWKAYEEIRNKIDELKCKQLKDKYVGKYIKYNDCHAIDTAEDCIYMFVTNIWESISDQRIYFEGDSLSSYFSEYDDITYFSWSPLSQNWFIPHDVINEEWQDAHIKIITEQEYKDAFYEATEQMITRFEQDFKTEN